MEMFTTRASRRTMTDRTTGQRDTDEVLTLDDLCVRIPVAEGTVQATDHVSLSVRRGEVLGIVGETGSGKTVTCRAMLGLLPTRTSTHAGSVAYPAASESDILHAPGKRLRRLWGDYISMIPQNPMTSLNPIQRIGGQIEEAVVAHGDLPKGARRDRVVELMTRVGIPAPKERMHDYPHQFSGGMLQRTLIAIALAGDPQVLIADEPTTALDVIIQDQILSLLVGLQRETGMGLVLVSHDLSVVAQICDRVAVMYAGQVVELAEARQLLHAPQHPYTAALLNSLPGAVPRDRPLATIPGSPPQLIGLGEGCRFVERCAHARPKCQTWTSRLIQEPTVGRAVRCVRASELDLTVAAYLGDGPEPLPKESL